MDLNMPERSSKKQQVGLALACGGTTGRVRVRVRNQEFGMATRVRVDEQTDVTLLNVWIPDRQRRQQRFQTEEIPAASWKPGAPGFSCLWKRFKVAV